MGRVRDHITSMGLSADEVYDRATWRRMGTDVEVVWATDEKRGALSRKEGDGTESTRKV